MAAKKAKKKPTPAQLAARKKFAAAAKARSKAAKGKKRNTTIIKAKRIEHLDVSKIHSLGKVENPNYTVEAIPKYTSTVKRDVKALSRGSAIRKVQREVEGPKNVYRYRVEKNPSFVIHKTLKATKRGNQAGWMLGNKFYAKRAGQKPLPGDSILDLNSGIVYQRVENPKRKAKGNPKRQNIAQGFYDGKAAGETGGKPRHARSKKRAAAARKASSTARSRAATKARKATTSRLASRALQRSVPLKRTRRNPLSMNDVPSGYVRALGAKQVSAILRSSRPLSLADAKVVTAKKAGNFKSADVWIQFRDWLYRREGKLKRNPDTPAQKLQEWQGYPKTGEDTLRFPTGTPSGLYKLGVLKKIILSNGATITPNAGQAWLCADTNGKLHIGGKTNTAAKGRVVDWPKDNLGKVKQVEYEARKPHLGDNERTIYFHKLGEDDGIKPTLHSDGEGGLLFKGGNYSLSRQGIIN